MHRLDPLDYNWTQIQPSGGLFPSYRNHFGLAAVVEEGISALWVFGGISSDGGTFAGPVRFDSCF